MSLAQLEIELREGQTKKEFQAAVVLSLTESSLANELRVARPIDLLDEITELRAEKPEWFRQALKLIGFEGESHPVSWFDFTLAEKITLNLRADLTTKALKDDLRQKTFQTGVAPSWLMPIETRIIMLSSGIKARIGLELVGDDAARLAELALQLEPIVKEVGGTSDVTALRLGGKPYIEFKIRRDRLAHYGVTVAQVQRVISVALGGVTITTTVEGRERYPVRVRYERELRDNIEELGDLLISTPSGAQVPITELADIEHVLGPSAIRGINGQLVGYVMFNPVDIDEVTLIQRVDARVKRAMEDGEVDWPAGYTYRWVGQYQEAMEANERLSFIIPAALMLIFLLVFFHFRRISTAIFVFSGVPLGVAGGILMVRYWPWLQAYFSGNEQGAPIYITVAVVVGFIALLGIIVDDGVVIGTYIQQIYEKRKPTTRAGIRAVVIEAGARRIRPTLMTTATTIIALAPVLWSTGRGSDVLQPMALPVIGGMALEILTLFVVPTAMCFWLELTKVKRTAAPSATE